MINLHAISCIPVHVENPVAVGEFGQQNCFDADKDDDTETGGGW